jgi:hypothetical protein
MEPIKKALTFLTIALFTSFVGVAQHKAVDNDESAFVNFLKEQNGQLYFTVKYQNAQGRRFDITVYDSYGENLYRGNFKGKDFAKVFRAPAELGKLVVSIRGYGKKAEHKFEISSEARIIRGAYVTAVQ